MSLIVLEDKPISINFYAAPGSGKSTSAARVFSELKNLDCNVELITEYAKRVVYERGEAKFRNQYYISAKQYKMMKDVTDYGVKLIITDCPLLLGLVYGKAYHQPHFGNLIRSLDAEFHNVNILVNRVKKYNPSGRLQTEAQSDAIQEELKDLVKFDYEINGDPEGQHWLANRIYQEYGSRIKV